MLFCRAVVYGVLASVMCTCVAAKRGRHEHGASHLKPGAPSQGEDDRHELHRGDFVQDREHLREHMQEGEGWDPDEATDAELEFHFFRLHDTDSNRKLDGLELMQAVHHALHEDEEEEKRKRDTFQKVKEHVEAMHHMVTRRVDWMMRADDKNDDGFIDYVEFSKSRSLRNSFRDM